MATSVSSSSAVLLQRVVRHRVVTATRSLAVDRASLVPIVVETDRGGAAAREWVRS